MSRPKGKKEYYLLSSSLSTFNKLLEMQVNAGWKPVSGTPCTISERGTEFNREWHAHQMLERTFYIEKEA